MLCLRLVPLPHLHQTSNVHFVQCIEVQYIGCQIASNCDPVRVEEAVRSLKVPTLLIRGRNSELVTAEDAEHFGRLVPHSEYVDVADAGHMVAGDRNDKFTIAVLDFMRRTFPLGVVSG